MKTKNILLILVITLIAFIEINNVSASENYGLFINGEEFTSEKTTINCDEGTATFDSSTNTLTLDNVTIDSHYWYDVIAYKGTEAFNIILVGDNEIYGEYDYAIFSNHDLTISGTGSLYIDSYNGICAYDDSSCPGNGSIKNEKVKSITFESEKIEIKTFDHNSGEGDGTGLIGNIISEYQVLAGPYGDTRDATVYKAEELYEMREIGWINYLKTGNFTANNIQNEISTSKFIYIPQKAVSGSKIRINTVSYKLYYDGIDYYDGTDMSAYGESRYFFNVSNVKIIKTSTGEDVTKTVKYNTTYHTFTMPNYDITIKGSLVRTYKAALTNFTKKINSSNNVTLTWKDPGFNGYIGATGYYIYVKKGNSTSWELLGDVKHKTYAPAGEDIDLNTFTAKLDQNTRYAFKILPYYIIPDGIFKDVKVASATYKTTNYMFTKMNLPVVEKYSKGVVRVKWKKVPGATKYQIARSVYKTRNYKTVKAVGSGYIGYRLSTKINKMYYYKVRACNSNGCSPWSNYKSFRLN